MDDNRVLLLEQIIDSQTKKVRDTVQLCVGDDGFIYLIVDHTSFKLAINKILDIHDPYITAYAHEHTESKILYPLNNKQLELVTEYFTYWNEDRLNKLVLDKWNSFLLFWNYTLNFIRDNIDTTNVTYKLYPTDYRMYEGNLTIQFDIHLTDAYSNEYDDYFRLNELWHDGYYDIHSKEDNEYYWFSGIHVNFKK